MFRALRLSTTAVPVRACIFELSRTAVLSKPSAASLLLQYGWQTDTGADGNQIRLYASKKKSGGGKKGAKADSHESDADSMEMTLDIDKTDEQMKHSIGRLASEFQAVRAGRANPAMLDHVKVLLKGGSASLSELAMIAVKDGHNLIVIPNDHDHLKAIDTSIRSAGLGLNPRIEKDAIIVPVPKSTKESREKLLKSLGAMAESARVHVRKHRQDAMKRLKEDAKSHMSKEDVNSWEKRIQTVTDKYTSKIEQLLSDKTREIKQS
ncbi:hypothetical protein LPJ73_002116 [Coemansia sp. RSA 2703]|nr:hypothetical protein LPJ73_002116 [Coemansia sp. RSA 2703]